MIMGRTEFNVPLEWRDSHSYFLSSITHFSIRGRIISTKPWLELGVGIDKPGIQQNRESNASIYWYRIPWTLSIPLINAIVKESFRYNNKMDSTALHWFSTAMSCYCHLSGIGKAIVLAYKLMLKP